MKRATGRDRDPAAQRRRALVISTEIHAGEHLIKKFLGNAAGHE